MKISVASTVLLAALSLASCRIDSDAVATVDGEYLDASTAAGLVLPGQPELGEAYDFSLKTIKGEEVSCDTLAGKVVLIDFWATWCPPCREEIPKLKELYAKHHDDGFEIVGLSFDRNLNSLVTYSNEHELPWHQVYLGELQKQVGQATGVTSIPRFFVLDRDHKLVTTTGRKNLEAILPGLLGV